MIAPKCEAKQYDLQDDTKTQVIGIIHNGYYHHAHLFCWILLNVFLVNQNLLYVPLKDEDQVIMLLTGREIREVQTKCGI